MKKVKASARVQLTIEVEPDDRWGSDCTVDQIQKQARESALARLALLMNGEGAARVATKFRVIGTPKVLAVVVEDES